MQAPNFPMAALRFLMALLGRLGARLAQALSALAILVGVQPALSRDPAIDAWETLSRRRRSRRGRRGRARRGSLPVRGSGPARGSGSARGSGPARGSVDDPHFQLRITM